MEVCGYHLGLIAEGSFEPISLLKSRSPGPNPITTPSSSSSTGSALDSTLRGATQSFNLPCANPSTSGNAMTLDTKTTPNPMPDVKGYSLVPVKEMHEFFITAVLSSITTSFCRQSGALALNHRCVLLPSQIFDSDDGDSGASLRTAALATFRVYLTTTGSLIISLCVSLLRGLMSSAESLRTPLLSVSPTVLAAPLGAFGTLQGIVDGDGNSGFVQSPDTQVSRLRPESTDKFSQWKSTCSQLLQMRGMSPSVVDGCPWLNIQFLQRKPYEHRADGKKTPLLNSPGPTAPWPAALCFGKRKIGTLVDYSLSNAFDASESEILDPLDEAKAWYEGQAGREEEISRRNKGKDADLTGENTDSDGENHELDGGSPLTLRQSKDGDAATAAGAMYPTPPDGVQPSGVSPLFGKTASSPSNPPAATITVDDVDTPPVPNDTPMADAFGENWAGGDAKREPQGTAYIEGENIYGDLGEDLFEGNELTEADFNFFDEQPSGAHLDLSGVPDFGATPADMPGSVSVGMNKAAEAPLTIPQVAVTAPDGDKMAFAAISSEFTDLGLKDDRSTLTGENQVQRQQTNTGSYSNNALAGIKRQPSPFTAETVYKRIRARLTTPPTSDYPRKNLAPRRPSAFAPVHFDPSLSRANQKYQGQGQYSYINAVARGREENNLLHAADPLRVGGHSGRADRRRSLKNLKTLPSNIGTLLAQMSAHTGDSSARFEDEFSDSDDMGLESDLDDTSETSEEPYSPVKSSMIRRRGDDDVVSMAASFKDLETASLDSPGYGSLDLSRLSHPEVPELSIANYFADPEPAPLRLSCSPSDFINLAQLVTTQAAYGSLEFLPQSPCPGIQDTRRSLVNATRKSVQSLRGALPRSLSGAAECQLKPLLEVQDVPLLGQPTRVQPRPHGQELFRPQIFQIPPPHIELRRYETPHSFLPTALDFWESLGLGPSPGPKDIVSICAFPHSEGMRDNAASFLDRMRSAYESLKLGTFETLPTSDGIVDGLLPLFSDDYDDTPSSQGGSAWTEHMMRLSQALATSPMTGRNFVVFFVYTPEDPSSIVDSVAAFGELFEYYRRDLSDRKKPQYNQLVLQLVSLSLIGSKTGLVVLSPSESSRLCLETYDRCTSCSTGTLTDPAIVLEQPLPRIIDFKVTTTPSPNLLLENSCMHIAYALSVDERWITAAWTDNRGKQQRTTSYCLGRRGEAPVRSFAFAANEIWETTFDLVPLNVHRRVIITKCGPMDQQEADIWINLAQNGSTNAYVTLTLATVDTNPSLQLVPPVAKLSTSILSVFNLATPVSTPQPLSTVSPDQSGNNPPTPSVVGGNNAGGAGSGNNAPTTPGGSSENPTVEPDGDTTIVDMIDTTWGVVVAHRLNNSTSLTELNPALASGYLVKRGGTRAEDAPVVMEVNIVHTEGNYRAYEPLLREMLNYFRGLGTLARARGVVDRVTDVRPWHVAAAEKAVRALYALM
ncbi:mediator of RNA polymerase II transcription subunit 13 [Diplogelasinospora grovesii]|uniref:Mediator of RNA polymerase II transcription subunit 13 n=1 Tax=Diplogelasinospora grovesii TaxID=303347 RepID=A0AAN6S5Z5_9PEZI|nr:mediator of RNA polymerase II transcription subunit 13 [Diplogelasinospora grovesii]